MEYGRNSDYQWFRENQMNLFEKYPDMFLIISDKHVLGASPSFDEALDRALEKKNAGEFIIQRCSNDTAPIQYYNGAVFF